MHSRSSRQPFDRRTGRSRRDIAPAEPTGLVLNKQELHSIREIAQEYRNVEFLYLRENEFTNFDPYIKLEHLKMLDLSLNSIRKCDFLWGGDVGAAEGPQGFRPENLQLPSLRHLYLTGNEIESLNGFRGLNELETLALSSNHISSFDGLGSLPQLRVLSLNFNTIKNFMHFPFLPCLHTLNLFGNPIDPDHRERPEDHEHFRVSAVAVAGHQLQKVDGMPVSQESREQAEFLRGKVVFCMTEGFELDYADADKIEDQAEKFLLEKQQRVEPGSNPPLFLHAIFLSPSRRTKHPDDHDRPGYPGDRPPTEGFPISLHICLQDNRPHATRSHEIFHSQLLFPVAFKVQGDATDVKVVGSMNLWGEPIHLERIEEKGQEVFFQANLYLPPGQYEYRYVVDGIDKVSGERKRQSDRGPVNIAPVSAEGAAEDDDEERNTILHVRWLRNNKFNGFDLIPEENQLTYTPVADDVGCCLRAEVLAYVNGAYSSMFFDLTVPIEPGQPTVKSIALEGEEVVGNTLELQVTYSGGQEGPSEVMWLRVKEDGTDEIDVTYEALDVFSYRLTEADIGWKIAVQYLPIRDDGFTYNEQGMEEPLRTVGESVRAFTAKVVSAATGA